jgi:hypothetical protein
VSKRRNLKYSDESNVIIDELFSAGIRVNLYLDRILREADSSWRVSVAKLREEGWDLGMYKAAMAAVGNVEGTESAQVICNRLTTYTNTKAHGIDRLRWNDVVARAVANIGVLRSLVALSRASQRGLGPLIERGIGHD